VEKSNGPGRVPPTADAGRPSDADGSDTFAGDFVRYAVLVRRPSCAEPIKYEAHFDYPPLSYLGLRSPPGCRAQTGSRCGPIGGLSITHNFTHFEQRDV